MAIQGKDDDGGNGGTGRREMGTFCWWEEHRKGKEIKREKIKRTEESVQAKKSATKEKLFNRRL
jgi:hypothetical protein